MQCLNCRTKACKKDGKDCAGHHDEALECYRQPDVQTMYEQADNLVSGGRAGTLSRFEEIVEFARAQQYRCIALAYCFSMEALASKVLNALRSFEFKVTSIRCSIGGVRENEVSSSLGAAVGCNPIGQAMSVNESDADFVIEMGLCMGHDVLFHQYLKKPFTVFIVKDRKYRHNPQKHFF